MPTVYYAVDLSNDTAKWTECRVKIVGEKRHQMYNKVCPHLIALIGSWKLTLNETTCKKPISLQGNRHKQG